MNIAFKKSTRIFADENHNAFTGIERFKDAVYIVFRSATTHVSFDGKITVIRSINMQHWETVAVLTFDGAVDLRDPKVIAFKNRLFVYCGNRTAPETVSSHVFVSENGRDFEHFAIGELPSEWLWCIREHTGKLYGTSYRKTNTSPLERCAYLHESEDGIHWKKITDLGHGNETAIDFDRNGNLFALLRDDEYGCYPRLAELKAPYHAEDILSLQTLPIRMQGPMLRCLEDGLLMACRQWPTHFRNNPCANLLFRPWDALEFETVMTLPSGGDTSYVGFLWKNKEEVYLSYYSTHEGSTAIYLAEIEIRKS